jgi:outer membrane protein OmpA-like peptidoglycan-associated protein
LLGLVLRLASPPPAVPVSPTAQDQEPLVDGPLAGELTGTVYFDLDSATLNADAKAELASVARVLGQLLSAQPERVVVLSGFHDTSGDLQSNARLALQRARTVRDALVQAGVALPQLRVRKPAQTQGGEQATLARRVEIRVLD